MPMLATRFFVGTDGSQPALERQFRTEDRGLHGAARVKGDAQGRSRGPELKAASQKTSMASLGGPLVIADLRNAETQLTRLPAVTTADPQAETAAQLVSWATFGMITLAANNIRMARIAGMALMPQLAGLVLMLAATLWPSCRPRAFRWRQIGDHDPWFGLRQMTALVLHNSRTASARNRRRHHSPKLDLGRLDDTCCAFPLRLCVDYSVR